MNSVLNDACRRAARYLEDIETRDVAPTAQALAGLEAFDTELQREPLDPGKVLAELDRYGSPATMASAGGRFFGFVVGGALPAPVAAHVLATAWDQNVGLHVLAPAASKLEEVSRRWLASLLGLPDTVGMGFVTGCTMANVTALAAARHAVLARAGWDVEADGMNGAPPVTVLVGEEAHVSIPKALAMLGLGRERAIRVPTDAQGRMRADALPAVDGPAIVCIQAGNVNTGAFDPAAAVCDWAARTGAWVHVDGAFGLWASASPALRHLVAGVERADSWATDAHKWLNTPYDCGVTIVRDPMQLRVAMSSSAAYLLEGEHREPAHFTPELSRRARGVDVWATLRSLGRDGVAELVERTCRHARRFAEGLRQAGYRVLTDVVLNQVLVSFGDTDTTLRVIGGIQRDGTCWCGGTVWQGHTAMRISVSSWRTTDEDVERSLEAMIRIAREVGEPVSG